MGLISKLSPKEMEKQITKWFGTPFIGDVSLQECCTLAAS
jgi:hypothetical protein